jgi:N-acetyl-gamma-glutamyl-phosphate reductase
MGKTQVGIINVTGYAGVEMARLLYKHPEVRLTSVTGHSAAGQKPDDFFPHLNSIGLVIAPDIGKADERISG